VLKISRKNFKIIPEFFIFSSKSDGYLCFGFGEVANLNELKGGIGRTSDLRARSISKIFPEIFYGPDQKTRHRAI